MQVNPSIALIIAFIYSLCVSFSLFAWYYLLPIVFVLIIHKSHLASILKKLLFLNLFIFVLFLVLLLQSTWQEAFNVYIRANAIILFNITLFFSSKGYDIIRGFSMLRFPHRVVAAGYFTLKMIDFLSSDFKQLKNTLKARGFKAKTTIFTYETFGNVLGLLFVKAIRKATALQNTFITRGFKGSIYLNDQFNINKVDYYLTGSLVLMILLKGVL